MYYFNIWVHSLYFQIYNAVPVYYYYCCYYYILYLTVAAVVVVVSTVALILLLSTKIHEYICVTACDRQYTVDEVCVFARVCQSTTVRRDGGQAAVTWPAVVVGCGLNKVGCAQCRTRAGQTESRTRAPPCIVCCSTRKLVTAGMMPPVRTDTLSSVR